MMGPGTAAVYRALREAAERGDPCPRRRVLCDAAGYLAVSSANKAIKALVKSGHIESVLVDGTTRIVTITETGWRTSLPPVQERAETKKPVKKSALPKIAVRDPARKRLGTIIRIMQSNAITARPAARQVPDPIFRRCQHIEGNPSQQQLRARATSVDPDDLFCVEKPLLGRPYCAVHHALYNFRP